MRKITFGLAAILLAVMMSGCLEARAPETAVPAHVTPRPGTVTDETMTPTEAARQDDPPDIATREAPSESFREAITAHEGVLLADEAAKAEHADYHLYEVLGCHKAGPYGLFERDSHLVKGMCTQWLFHFVRPFAQDSLQGYHALHIRVGPNGVLSIEEHSHEARVRKRAQGDLAAWQVDSAQAIEIAERDGGQAYRIANPEWDTARLEADRNAILTAKLHFFPYWDPDSGQEYAGSANIVWVIQYPPLRALVFIIDAATGEVLLQRAD